MAFVGYIASVIAKKANDVRRERKKASFNQQRSYSSGIYKKFIDHRKMSASQFTAFQEELRKQRRNLTIKNIVLVVFSSLVTLVTVYYFISYIETNF
ncbi:MAG TPA: hypothetical protein DEA82_10515 [Flavobacteriaceae bacterium]|nr:hypothetical protein [Flavobacteriaceae bacterium]MAY52407.1 hypothetical protein [Flavobacteriaceae bacterium]HBR54577.1 hypothetical protein [Flavobacteriaceae bacterium]|tara:strand:- start:161 stop:451 length:291 start_codon:yes stop_codon:yes gene_type:complete